MSLCSVRLREPWHVPNFQKYSYPGPINYFHFLFWQINYIITPLFGSHHSLTNNYINRVYNIIAFHYNWAHRIFDTDKHTQDILLKQSCKTGTYSLGLSLGVSTLLIVINPGSHHGVANPKNGIADSEIAAIQSI